MARLDEHQVLAYDLAHAASAVEGCRVMLDYAEHGEFESRLARAFIADAIADVAAPPARARRDLGRRAGRPRAPRTPSWRSTGRPRSSSALADELPRHGTGPTHLADDFELVRETFRRFAEDKIRPVAEHVHRTNADIPEDIIARARRARRLRPVGARGVRRVRDRRRVRLPRHGRRDRGALVGLARRRRLARSRGPRSSPARSSRAAPRSRSSAGSRRSRPASSWSA